MLTGEERVSERLVYSIICFDTIASERGGNIVDGLTFAMKDKRLEAIIIAVAKAQASAHVKANKPKPERRDKPIDKQDKRVTNKAKLKDHRSLPPTDKTHKKI
jgi:hypothetical protein